MKNTMRVILAACILAFANADTSQTDTSGWPAGLASAYAGYDDGPAGWPEKAASHTPVISFDGTDNFLTVTINHALETPETEGNLDGHYYTSIFVENQDGVVSQSGFIDYDIPTEDADPPIIARFDLGALADVRADGATLQAYAHCNLHGVWESDAAFDVSIGARHTAWLIDDNAANFPEKASSHTPTITQEGANINFDLTHGTSSFTAFDDSDSDNIVEESVHYIAAAYITNADGEVVVSWDAAAPTAETANGDAFSWTTTIDGATNGDVFTAHAFCDKHGVWSTEFTYDDTVEEEVVEVDDTNDTTGGTVTTPDDETSGAFIAAAGAAVFGGLF